MRVVPAGPEHVAGLLARPLRQVDVDEWVLATGRPVRETLRDGELEARALVDAEGRCLCLWGVTEDPPGAGIGSVWLIASEEAEGYARSIHRHWRQEVALMHATFPTLVAVSYHRNTMHHDWLRAIGFSFTRRVEVGPLGARYAVFVRSKKDRA